MRSLGIVLVTCTFLTFSSLSQANDNDSGDLVVSESTESDQTAETKKKSTGSSETIMDTEAAPRTDASGSLIDANFLSIGGTPAWLSRNGLGAHAGFGGYNCHREYCDTTLDTKMPGSISLILGAYYRITPNWSVFADFTMARINTNMRLADGDNHGVAVQFLFGPAFHLPVKGWLDIYTSLGFGPASLRAITDEVKHRWGGFDIEWSLGANFYFWSVGVLKNFSVGPFFKFGFPIWAKVCVEDLETGTCDKYKPSEMPEETQTMFWSETPFTFQMGLEARLEFSLGFGGSDDVQPLSAKATNMSVVQKDNAKKNEAWDKDKDGADADAKVKGSANITL